MEDEAASKRERVGVESSEHVEFLLPGTVGAQQ
jgi:hypothetical protein